MPLHEAAAATGSGARAKPAIPAKMRCETLLAPPVRTINFLHMGFAFRRIPDILQVIQRKRCKKESIPSEKYKKQSFLALQ